MNESITDEGSKQDIGITWIEFCQSQQVFIEFYLFNHLFILLIIQILVNIPIFTIGFKTKAII